MHDGSVYYYRLRIGRLWFHLFLCGDPWYLHTHTAGFVAVALLGVAKELLYRDDGERVKRYILPFVPRRYEAHWRHTILETNFLLTVNWRQPESATMYSYRYGDRPTCRWRYK